MRDKLIFILPVITLLAFFYNAFKQGNTVQSCLWFILAFLPFMDLKITKEAYGGFKVFDAISYYCVFFLIKDFIRINLRSRKNVYFFMSVAFIIVVMIGKMASEFPDKLLITFLKTVPIFIIARFFITECVNDPSFHLKAINALKIAFLIDLGFLVGQLAVGLGFTFYPGLAMNTIDPVFHIVRYPGVFYDSQAHGQYLALGSFLFLYRHESYSNRKVWFNYGVFTFCLAAIALAGSRSAFGGFAVGLFLVLLMASKQYRIYGSIILVLGVAAYFIISPTTGVFSRTKAISEDYLYRQSIWTEALEISRKHPYLGIGTNNYQRYIMRHVQDQYIEIEDGQLVYFDQPENGYLKILVENGYIGFTIFLLFLFVPLMSGLVNYFRGKHYKQIVFFMASMISWMVAFNTVYSIYDYRLLLMVVSMITLMITYPPEEYVDEMATT
ncbi:MAG: O-antigen polymerase [Sphingobacteriaceae bacterium]|jgi:hypothetical protein|nr:O-antigen polymerase [Sphingobacteriaceae bacterium]